MRSENCLSGEQITSIFEEEISCIGGAIHEAVDIGTQFFVRGTLPQFTEIQRGDRVQGGIAIRATEDEIFVHPYTFRLVCKNGAILAHAIETRQIVEAEYFDVVQSELMLREAIQLCSAPEAFAQSAAEMRDANTQQIDMLLMLAPMLNWMTSDMSRRMLAMMVARFGGQRQGTRYELMNHITATARDTRDPAVKWELEELGAAVAAGLIYTPRRVTSVRLRAPVTI